MPKKIKLMELFSGIGSQAKALRNLGVEVNTVGTCEWDYHAFVAYDAIHNFAKPVPDDIIKMSKEELLDKLGKFTISNTGKTPLAPGILRTYSRDALARFLTAIRRCNNFVDISNLKGSDMPDKIDILTYSFPCQDLSNVGAFHGYNKGIDKDSGSRSSLLWQVGRILTEMRNCGKYLPDVLLMENVPSLLSDRHKHNFDMWISDLRDLGYVSHYYQLNASDFGQAQNRPRLLMISVFAKGKHKFNTVSHFFSERKQPADIIREYRNSDFYQKQRIKDCLRTDYSNPFLFDEALECNPNDTESRRKIWEDNPQIILPGNILNKDVDVIRTVTTKQDRNPNSGNLFFESGIEGRSKFRYLTPRECLLFMGFTDEDYEHIKGFDTEYHKGDSLFARDKIIRMAGNSIPVKLLEGVFYQILRMKGYL